MHSACKKIDPPGRGCRHGSPFTSSPLRDFFPTDRPGLVLAPMQDVTDLAFMTVAARRGGPDVFVTEYFRVHACSRLAPDILRSITENATGRPVFAQMIGQDIDALVRSAKELLQYPVAGIDLNLGCPSPTVCSKHAGGGLLRTPEKIDAILGALREAIAGRFTVKTRVGYETPDEFTGLLEVFARHSIDALSIHGRTVRERYQTPVHPECVRMATERLNCPVIANGNVVDVPTGLAYQKLTGAAGLMIGRGAIRNPWLFAQLRAAFAGESGPRPTRRDLWDYIRDLWREMARNTEHYEELAHTQRMKRPLVYITQGIEPEFEFRIRRAKTEAEFDLICREHLDNEVLLESTPPENSKLFRGFSALTVE